MNEHDPSHDKILKYLKTKSLIIDLLLQRFDRFNEIYL